MSSVNQGLCWDAGDMLGQSKAQGRAETSASWTPRPWKASPAMIHWRSRWAKITICRSAGLLPHRPAGLLPTSLPGLCPIDLPDCHPPTCHLLTGLLPHQASACQLARPPTATGGLQHHQMSAPNLPRRHRQTGLEPKGVIPELLRLKFYCSWTRNLFFYF
jgi:hypothetical protein